MDQEPELFKEHKLAYLRKYITGLGILIITFAIPVTLTQLYQTNNLSSSANNNQPQRTLQSYIIPSITPTALLTNSSSTLENSNSLLLYLGIGLVGIGLLGMLTFLVILYFKTRS